MESRLKERLVKFAEAIQLDPAFTMAIIGRGILVSYRWETARGRIHIEEEIVSWDDMERDGVNPLILSRLSITKKASASQ